MKKYIIKVLLIFLFTMLIVSVVESEELDFSDEQTAKEVFLGKSLYCRMDETNYHGPIVIETKSIKGKNFKGLSREWCHQVLNWKGKFKKNRMKITQVGVSAQTCYCRTGFLDFIKESDGSIIGAGKYKVGCGATPFKGELKCKIE